MIEEVTNTKDFQKTDTEIGFFENIEELKNPQDYEDGGIIILDDSNEKEFNNDKIQAIFKQGRHNILSIFIISQDYYQLPKRTIRAKGKIYHIFQPKNLLDVRNIYQDKASMDMTLDEIKYLASSCWNQKYQILTIDMTEDRYQG